MTPPLDERALEEAARAAMEVRRNFGEPFTKRPKVMAIDTMIATAAVTAYLAALPSAGREDVGGSTP